MISKARKNKEVHRSIPVMTNEPPLVTAVRTNQVSKVEELLAAGHNPNATDAGNMSCLTYAAKNRNVEIVKLLINAGAKNNKMPATAIQRKYDAGGWTALMYAAENGDSEIVSLILAVDENTFQRGGDRNVNVTDNKGRTALSIAIENGRLGVAELLIKSYANPLIVDDEGNTALDLTIARGFKKLVSLMRGFIKPIDDDYKLFSAILNDEVEIAELLLKNNANPNARNKNWETPLMFAMKSKKIDLDLVQLLLRAGADPNVKDETSHSPLLKASLSDNYALVELLLRYGANTKKD